MEQALVNQKELIERLRSMAHQAQFVSFTYCNKEANELARHTLLFGSSYTKQIKESLLALQLLEPTFTTPLQKQAAKELKESFLDTLASFEQGKYNSKYTKPQSYVLISNGLKFNVANGTMNVSGLAHNKAVLRAGVYKKVNSSDLTLAKKAIKEQLPVARWREFVISLETMKSARLQGVELCFD